MLHHIVLFRLQDKDGQTAQELARAAKKRAEHLAEVIPGIASLTACVGRNGADPLNHHLMLHGVFADDAALRCYSVHPEHQDFLAFLRGIIAPGGRACIDFDDET